MPRTILIVEDTELCRETLEVALMKVPDLSVQSVKTAEEALQYLAGGDVCALITDLNLPAMDGLELIAAARSQTRTPPLPILVISGDSDPSMPQRVAGLGADAFFSKPYSPAAVRLKLEELIAAHSGVRSESPAPCG